MSKFEMIMKSKISLNIFNTQNFIYIFKKVGYVFSHHPKLSFVDVSDLAFFKIYIFYF